MKLNAFYSDTQPSIAQPPLLSKGSLSNPHDIVMSPN